MFFADIIARLNESWAKSPLGGHSASELFAHLTLTVVSWGVFRAVYLLYFHPLASFPGPYKAALSTWWLYGVSKTGRTEELLEELHKNTRALRIAPNELHITDPRLYHTIYSQRYTYTKQKFFYDGFNTPHSVFVETDKDLHRSRRKMLNNFFSKASVRSIEGILKTKIAVLCNRLSETRGDGAINMYHAFRCLTIDFITEVAFGESFDLLTKSENNTYNAPFLEAFDLASASIWDFIYMPFTRFIANNSPRTVTATLSQPAARLQDLISAVANTLAKFRQLNSSGKTLDHDVIFTSMAHLDDKALMAEAVDILVAGSDTTATTLAVALGEMIKDPTIPQKIKDELRKTGMTAEQEYTLVKLEQLPFLSACVKEALRYAMPVPGRLPRVVPDGVEPLIASVSISAYTVHFDESIWGEDARSFNPNRWQTGNGKELEKYLVTFSKGARQCLGINLAFAEVTFTLAVLANRFRFTADKSITKSDLERMDNFTMGFEGTGVRAIVHEDKE
ncbi:hypothetical protein N0V94_005332 [Neodidymelliopsis sp. IMI 364377]|nr:hypothetical protein N0V94_005332 [Neodidymelliopsis sp. IMI 364377]